MNYTLESFIDFCDGMEIAEEGTRTEAYSKYKAFVKAQKADVKRAKKLEFSNPAEAVSKYKELVKRCSQIKAEIARIPKEDDKLFSRILTEIKAGFIPKDELADIKVYGNYVVSEYRTYEDEHSKYSSTGVEKSIHQYLNLCIHTYKEKIKKLEYQMKHKNN